MTDIKFFNLSQFLKLQKICKIIVRKYKNFNVGEFRHKRKFFNFKIGKICKLKN